MTSCPLCHQPIVGRFCENDGYDSVTGRSPERVAKLAMGADRAHYDRMVDDDQREGLPFPQGLEVRRFELTGDLVTLGRVSPGKPVDVDIALTDEGADPGISHHQCVFRRDGDSWEVRDGDGADHPSTNGTFVNDHDKPLDLAEPHQLAPGDRIYVGAWTCLSFELD